MHTYFTPWHATRYLLPSGLTPLQRVAERSSLEVAGNCPDLEHAAAAAADVLHGDQAAVRHMDDCPIRQLLKTAVSSHCRMATTTADSSRLGPRRPRLPANDSQGFRPVGGQGCRAIAYRQE